jgi:hypothetical protein
MLRKLFQIVVILFATVSLAAPGRDQQKSTMKKKSDDNQKQVIALFKKHCAISGCHRGQRPKKKLSLEADKFLTDLVDVPSLQVDSLKRVDTYKPENSYLLMKVKGAKGIVGERMPDEAPALKPEEIAAIEQWVQTLKAVTPKTETEKSPEAEKKSPKMNDQASGDMFEIPAFWGTQLINLQTTKEIGKKEVLFRVSHRFYPAIREGYDSYFGLNGPANIFISLGYGIAENLSFAFGHSKLNHEWEFTLQWRALEQGTQFNFPLSVSLKGSGSLITEKQKDKSVFRSENMKANLQLIMSRQFSNALSLELVPSFSTNTNTFDPLSENTFILGTGGRFMVFEYFSFIGEWLPVLSGYKNKFNGWGLGAEYKIGGHVFQVFVTNAVGLTSDQFITGGDLSFKDNDYRFGFNIFRSFWF